MTQDMERIKQVRNSQAREQAIRFLEQMGSLGYTREEIKHVLEELFDTMKEEGTV